MIAYFQSVDIVREHDDLVTSVFVIFDEELACLELVGVHAVQQHPLPRLFPEVLAIEFWRHGAPHLCTLVGSCNMVSQKESRCQGGRMECTWTFAICPFAARSLSVVNHLASLCNQ